MEGPTPGGAHGPHKLDMKGYYKKKIQSYKFGRCGWTWGEMGEILGGAVQGVEENLKKTHYEILKHLGKC